MITLERFGYTPYGTFGRLVYNDFRAFTVERPWQNNEAQVSCIPEGTYTLQWYNSPKFKKTLAVVGNTVSLFPTPGIARSAILIHPANTMDELQGCIALGSTLGWVNNKWAVLNSKTTVEKFLSLIPDHDMSLEIKQITPAVL